MKIGNPVFWMVRVNPVDEQEPVISIKRRIEKMLPEPEDVARFLKRTVLKSKKQRARDAEIQRDVQVRTAKGRIQQQIKRQKELVLRYKALARKALSLNDEGRFRQAGAQMLAAQRAITTWEKYLLSFELLESRREQVQATAEMMKALQAMGESLESLAEPVMVEDLQTQLERGLAQASSLEERMEAMMGLVDTALQADAPVESEALGALEDSLLNEIQQQEAAEFDPEIEDALAEIRKTLEDK
jgi:hypothetical protein